MKKMNRVTRLPSHLFLSIGQTRRSNQQANGRMSAKAMRDAFRKLAIRTFGQEETKEISPRMLCFKRRNQSR
jgi:hypothetical protein